MKEIIKLFKEFQYKYTLWDVFSDFLELSAISISNSIIKDKAKENRYFQIIKKYQPKDLDNFAKILAYLVIELEKGYKDVLGEVFMQLELGSKWKGQFFTPYHVCKLMAELNFKLPKEEVITLNEPCVGGGAMVIAYTEVMKENGYNPQTQLKITCQDLDIKAVHMAYIQLSLLGLQAKVYHMNTLTLETYSEWKTPFWILKKFQIISNNRKHLESFCI